MRPGDFGYLGQIRIETWVTGRALFGQAHEQFQKQLVGRNDRAHALIDIRLCKWCPLCRQVDLSQGDTGWTTYLRAHLRGPGAQLRLKVRKPAVDHLEDIRKAA